MEKIKMTTPLVEMDGDEMTRVIWKMIKDILLAPYIDLNTEYYDLGLVHRNETNDRVTIDSANAAACILCMVWDICRIPRRSSAEYASPEGEADARCIWGPSARSIISFMARCRASSRPPTMPAGLFVWSYRRTSVQKLFSLYC